MIGNSIQQQSPLQSSEHQDNSEKNHSVDQDVTGNTTLQQSPLQSLTHQDHIHTRRSRQLAFYSFPW